MYQFASGLGTGLFLGLISGFLIVFFIFTKESENKS